MRVALEVTRLWFRIPYQIRRPVTSLVSLPFQFTLPPPTKFIVISSGRSGSSYLMSLLGSHPAIRHCGELVGESRLRWETIRAEIRSRGLEDYVCDCFRRHGREAVVGFKVLYYQFGDQYGARWGVDSISKLQAHLESDMSIKIIHLKRRNVFHTLVSGRVAGLTGQYRVDRAGEHKETSVEISSDDCLRAFQTTRRWEQLYDDTFAEHPFLEIFYEDLINDIGAECDRMLDFLGVERTPLQTRTLRQRQQPLSEIVTNYDHLKRHFAETEWADFFEE